MNYPRPRAAFTLVEILIVVLILGILAMLVMPQFTKATQDARENSCEALLHTIRAQTELYRLQHGGNWPTDDGTAFGFWDWEMMTKTSAYDSNGDGTDEVFGPYLQSTPRNPFNNLSSVESMPSSAVGFVFEPSGKFYAVGPTGAAFGD